MYGCDATNVPSSVPSGSFSAADIRTDPYMAGKKPADIACAREAARMYERRHHGTRAPRSPQWRRWGATGAPAHGQDSEFADANDGGGAERAGAALAPAA